MRIYFQSYLCIIFKALLVASNSIESIGCVAICAGVLENDGLTKIVLDGNPIGEEGAKALMVCDLISGMILISSCPCSISSFCPPWLDIAWKYLQLHVI